MIYDIYTDGSCNQGSVDIINTNGGWAFLIVDENSNIVMQESGSELSTTNNRCEMEAIIQSIVTINNNKHVFNSENNFIINCDSAYIVNAFEDGWIDKWDRNNWKTSKGEDVLNQDCWKKLISLKKMYNMKFNKVKRKSNTFAKKVDFLAREKMRS